MTVQRRSGQLPRLQATRIGGIGAARYLFVLPALIFILAFFAYPLADNIVVSFQDVNLFTYLNGNAPFIGLSNYSHVVQTEVFQQAARTIAVFCLFSISFQFICGMLLALFFNHSFPLARITRSLLLIPWLLPVIVTSTAFKWLFTDPNGLINYVLVDGLHLMSHGRAWLADPPVGTACGHFHERVGRHPVQHDHSAQRLAGNPV